MEGINKETQELLNQVDAFAAAMKERIIQKSKEGYSEWKEYNSIQIAGEIDSRLHRIFSNNKKDISSGSIGIANWCLINWVNSNNAK